MPAPNQLVRPYGTAAIEGAAAVIRGGGIVAVPTETVYGLAADAGNGEAVARVYAAKGRPAFNPLIVHVADAAAAAELVSFDDDARALAAVFWPGPLTLVLPLRPGAGIASLVTAGLATLAVRVPAHRAMQALIAASGRPLAAPSANRSNGLSPTTAAHVVASLGDAAGLVIDDGPCAAGVESTILAGRRILRPGPIPAATIAAVLGGGLDDAPAGAGPVVAPGQLATHYAPAKPLRLNAVSAMPGEWLIGFGAVTGDATLSAAGDPVEAAANLFAALHDADTSPAGAIAVAPIPAAGIGAAINDRLTRAACR
jgi:L-threonylcarbamoyladenylate synthase